MIKNGIHRHSRNGARILKAVEIWRELCLVVGYIDFSVTFALTNNLHKLSLKVTLATVVEVGAVRMVNDHESELVIGDTRWHRAAQAGCWIASMGIETGQMRCYTTRKTHDS